MAYPTLSRGPQGPLFVSRSGHPIWPTGTQPVWPVTAWAYSENKRHAPHLTSPTRGEGPDTPLPRREGVREYARGGGGSIFIIECAPTGHGNYSKIESQTGRELYKYWPFNTSERVWMGVIIVRLE
jgi:hypothetical protein